jgi:glycosyltransferase involved in cell wall biosynthesis
MGLIAPYDGPKDYARPVLLFVAKHYFAAKGGPLLVEAFRIALAQRPDLRLTIVADVSACSRVPTHPAIAFHSGLTWDELQGLFRNATLLVQPMLNDPWGQVYLEALASRTPVMGLRRHGLPEITGDGRYGFLVDHADPLTLADAILDALDDPGRLARMANEGQRHVVAAYSWDAVARRVALT